MDGFSKVECIDLTLILLFICSRSFKSSEFVVCYVFSVHAVVSFHCLSFNC
jgi:hypothetical protein